MISTWAAERPLGLFGAMTGAVREAGVAEPFPGAFDCGSYCRARLAGEFGGDAGRVTIRTFSNVAWGTK